MGWGGCLPVATRNSRLTDQGTTDPWREHLDDALWKYHGIIGRRPNDTETAKIKERIATDPEFYLLGGFVRTFDETAKPHERVKPLFDPESPNDQYLKRIVREIHENYEDNAVIAVCKSRQLRLTWTATGYVTWEAREHPHSRCMMQSKKAEDAWKLVYTDDWMHCRAGFIEYALPFELRATGLVGKRGELIYPNGSEIWGIPQGAHQFRSYTASLVVCDEAAFQPEFEEAFTAALPMARRIVVISTALGGSFFGKLIEQANDDEGERAA